MKTIELDARDLLSAVRLVSLAIERRNTIPILGQMRFTASKGFVKLAGTNLDQIIETTVAGIGAGGFDLMLPPKIVERFLAGSSGTVSIAVSGGKKPELTLSNGNAEMRVEVESLMPVEDWPDQLSNLKPAQDYTLPESEIHRALALCRPCISTEETRYYLNGAFIHSINGKLAVVATDGHRLTLVKTEIEADLPPDQDNHSQCGFILPNPAVDTLSHVTRKGGNASVRMRTFASSWVQFTHPTATITTKYIDGKFPDYNKVIPKAEPKLGATLKPADVARFSNPTRYYDGIKCVVIDPKSNTASQKQSHEGATITAKLSGETMGETPFGFNAKYLKDFTKILGDITLKAENKGAPFIISNGDESVVAVQMPMRV